jgi:hypothetical protein
VPKLANSKMPPPIQVPRSPVASRPIKSFDGSVPSGGAAKHADRIKPSDKAEAGAIDPRQQVY